MKTKGIVAKLGKNVVQPFDMGFVLKFDGGVLGKWTCHTILTPLFP